ncbi:phosphate acetyltransferase [Murdochiella vaginalis]|uniref:phosphate acetyltransferase n=1 Tax=Murdochiella vaginalis TaxID=1852373 RepID=UPI0008FEAB17|nr:phosphate acetyltransferase [Murdochiella vaginalis]
MTIVQEAAQAIKGKNIRIVYPEGTDARILHAAVRHAKDGIIHPILLGRRERVEELAKQEGVSLEGLEFIDYLNYDHYDEMLAQLLERRKGKIDETKAHSMLKDRNYFGTMLVYMGKADGLVSGADGPTGDTIRPALQIIKTKPDAKLVSGCFIMISPDEKERLLFADSAVNISPSEEELADIAYQTAQTAKLFNIEPNVAMLSFSTYGSASSPEQERMANATAVAKKKYPDLNVDGEMQLDAAWNETVAKKKAPGSTVAGKARVFIFPDLQSGNIGYKIAQRLGNYTALGPLLQGMARPVNDLSRGCSEQDAYEIGIITAFQAMY